jgi:hypothetical protein
MGAPTITVQLPVPVYTRLQMLATREHTDPVEMIDRLVTIEPAASAGDIVRDPQLRAGRPLNWNSTWPRFTRRSRTISFTRRRLKPICAPTPKKPCSTKLLNARSATDLHDVLEDLDNVWVSFRTG